MLGMLFEMHFKAIIRGRGSQNLRYYLFKKIVRQQSNNYFQACNWQGNMERWRAENVKLSHGMGTDMRNCMGEIGRVYERLTAVENGLISEKGEREKVERNLWADARKRSRDEDRLRRDLRSELEGEFKRKLDAEK